MTPKQARALLVIGIGLLLMTTPQYLAPPLAGTVHPYVMATVHLLSPLGFIVFALGIYRYATASKGE